MGCNTSNIKLSSSRIIPQLVLSEDNPMDRPEIMEPNETPLIAEDNLLEKIQNSYRNLEWYTLLWIDENIKTKLDYQSKFRQIINQLIIYENPFECQKDFEEKFDKNEKYVLIISGSGKTRQLILNIHNLPQLSICYILCEQKFKKLNEEFAQNFLKVRILINK